MEEQSITAVDDASRGSHCPSFPVITAPGRRLCGTTSPVLNGAARVGHSLRILGLRGTVAEVADVLSFQIRERKRTGAAGISPGSKVPGACSWLGDGPEWTVAHLTVTDGELAAFMARTQFPRFYYWGWRRVWYALWHHVGFALCGLTAASVVVDVGAGMGIWGRIARRQSGCMVLDVDCRYPPGIHGRRIGAGATDIPLPENSVSHVVSFCAFNCFEGTADTGFLWEAYRLLMPGGKLVVVPLYICDDYVNLFDPSLCAGADVFDPGAQRTPWQGWGNRFGRWYDREAFRQRLVVQGPPYERTIVRVDHDIRVPELASGYYAISFVKPSASPRQIPPNARSARPYAVAWRLAQPSVPRST